MIIDGLTLVDSAPALKPIFLPVQSGSGVATAYSNQGYANAAFLSPQPVTISRNSVGCIFNGKYYLPQPSSSNIRVYALNGTLLETITSPLAFGSGNNTCSAVSPIAGLLVFFVNNTSQIVYSVDGVNVLPYTFSWVVGTSYEHLGHGKLHPSGMVMRTSSYNYVSGYRWNGSTFANIDISALPDTRILCMNDNGDIFLNTSTPFPRYNLVGTAYVSAGVSINNGALGVMDVFHRINANEYALADNNEIVQPGKVDFTTNTYTSYTMNGTILGASLGQATFTVNGNNAVRFIRHAESTVRGLTNFEPGRLYCRNYGRPYYQDYTPRTTAHTLAVQSADQFGNVTHRINYSSGINAAHPVTVGAHITHVAEVSGGVFEIYFTVCSYNSQANTLGVCYKRNTSTNAITLVHSGLTHTAGSGYMPLYLTEGSTGNTICIYSTSSYSEPFTLGTYVFGVNNRTDVYSDITAFYPGKDYIAFRRSSVTANDYVIDRKTLAVTTTARHSFFPSFGGSGGFNDYGTYSFESSGAHKIIGIDINGIFVYDLRQTTSVSSNQKVTQAIFELYPSLYPLAVSSSVQGYLPSYFNAALNQLDVVGKQADGTLQAITLQLPPRVYGSEYGAMQEVMLNNKISTIV